MPHVDSFRYAIWDNVMNIVRVEENGNATRYVNIDIPLESFRLFDFWMIPGFEPTHQALQSGVDMALPMISKELFIQHILLDMG